MAFQLKYRQTGGALIGRIEQLLAADAAQRSVTTAQLEARRWSLATFVKAAWRILEPSTPLQWSWHLQAVADHIEALYEGKLAHNNLWIAVPPGSGKSRLASVMAPSWWWTRRPTFRSIYASANPRTSVRDSLLTRTLITSSWYRNTFGVCWDLADDQDQKTLFNNTAGGWRMSTTTGARIIGDRADLIACDDPLDAQDAFSSASREAVIQWWSQAYGNRLSDLRTGKRLIISQRLHQEDLIGWLSATEPRGWESLVIPMLWEESRRFTTSLGWTDPRQTEGALMFEARFTPAVVEAERLRLGRSGFDGQMQQRPSAAEGEIFTRGHLQLLPLDQLPLCTEVLISLDTAFSTKTTADYSAAVVLGKHAKGFTVLDVVRARLAFPQLVQVVEQLAMKWQPTAVLVESKASGQSLVQELQQNSSLPIKGIEVASDKVSRANACTPTWEANRVYAAAGSAWLDDFESELYAFPKAPNDDQTDAFTQAILFSIQARPGAGLINYYQNLIAAQSSAPKPGTQALVNTLPRAMPPGALWAMAAKMGGKVSSL
jgi:predicted phage terminase large subunit-like protein